MRKPYNLYECFPDPSNAIFHALDGYNPPWKGAIDTQVLD